MMTFLSIFISLAYSSSIDSMNTTDIFCGLWSIFPYTIDHISGLESQQPSLKYIIELKNNWQTSDIYGFVHTYIGGIKKDNPISIRLHKTSGYNHSYFAYISTSDIAVFREFVFLNMSTLFNKIFTSSGTYLYGHYSFMLHPPNFAEIITYGANSDQINLYRLFKEPPPSTHITVSFHWSMPLLFMIMLWLTRFLMKTFYT